ncbi:MAG: 50S ribosomal protein L30 [Saprospirales bacterium]|nr:MAG: 50S ribosomal protein L30 [Saprospirales bacterium]
MEKIIVTQVRSSIDRPKRQKATLIALGLGRINKSKEHTLSPQVKGMINKVSHLIKVEEAS